MAGPWHEPIPRGFNAATWGIEKAIAVKGGQVGYAEIRFHFEK
jgi:hypothetical protein